MKKLLSISLLSVFAFAACMNGGEAKEREQYLTASADIYCWSKDIRKISNFTITDFEEQLRGLLEKHGYDPDDQETLDMLAAKYDREETFVQDLVPLVEHCATEQDIDWLINEEKYLEEIQNTDFDAAIDVGNPSVIEVE